MGFKLIPSTSEQNQARNYLTSLLMNEINTPTQQIASLTPEQQALQAQTAETMAAGSAGYNSAMNYLQQVLSGKYDPRTSPYYEGLRAEAEAMKSDTNAAIRRQSQAGGMMYSTPSAGVQASNSRRYDNQTLTHLGSLYENERNRMGQAALGMGTLTNQQMSNIGAANQMFDQQRAIEQARLDAQFNATMSDLLAPYQYQANIAGTLLGETRYFYKSKQSSGIGGALIGGGAQLGSSAIIASALKASALSDERLKENIEPIDNAIDKIELLTGYTYNYKFNPQSSRNGGVMAQDLEKVLPEAVTEVDGVKFVRYDAVIGLLVNAVRELSDKVKGLENA